MAFCDIVDTDLEIISWVANFKFFIHPASFNKNSYKLITNSSIYNELTQFKFYRVPLKFNKPKIINICYEYGLINILKILEKK